jgi:hypothetical protein
MERNIRKNSIVVAVYSHPEFYPPTLNAIQELSKQFEKVFVLSRNVLKTEWEYPKNVKLIKSGKFKAIRDSEKSNIFIKVISFLTFTLHFIKLIITKKPRFVQVCDVIPLFSLFLIKNLISKKTKIWYHNHDVSDIDLCRKYSIGWFASKYEDKMFQYIDIFTLPAKDREKYFPLKNLKGQYYFLPNYPSLHFYNKFNIRNKVIENKIKLVYQGSIGPEHGLEEIIKILNKKILGLELTLHLKGYISNFYRTELTHLAKNNLVESKVHIHGVIPYRDLPRSSSNCSIGIGIYRGGGIMNSTVGTSSNKIYEYVALGLPVLLYDNLYFRNLLGKNKWAVFTDLNESNLIQSITNIVSEYSKMSQSASENFNNELNYEIYFKKININ